jgi:hypothetical protein
MGSGGGWESTPLCGGRSWLVREDIENGYVTGLVLLNAALDEDKGLQGDVVMVALRSQDLHLALRRKQRRAVPDMRVVTARCHDKVVALCRAK